MAATAPIVIAGGGIAGLALALALARKGCGSTVLEAQPQFVGGGAGIQLGPNGVRVLEQLGIAGALQPLAGSPEAIHIRVRGKLDILARLPLGDWIAARHGAPYWAVHRSDLHSVLLNAVSRNPHIELRMGFEVASLNQDEGEVRASSSHGKSVAGGVLIGADGLWSMVRREIFPSVIPQPEGATATRAVLPIAAAAGLNERVVGLWLAPGCNVVHYPVRGGKELAIVIIAADDWRETAWDGVADRDGVLARLAGFGPELTEVLGRVHDWRRWALYRLPPLPAWSDRRVGLTGDAAHAMLPHLAQGGVLALEDAVLLADCLSADGVKAGAALDAYAAMRRKRAAKMQVASRRNGWVYHLPPPLSWARDAALYLLPGAWFMAAYDWVYAWQPSPGDPRISKR